MTALAVGIFFITGALLALEPVTGAAGRRLRLCKAAACLACSAIVLTQLYLITHP